MKTYRKVRSSKGFTLIELLVVITIIAVLAGLSFAGVNVAIKKSKRVEAQVAATALKQAVDNFYGEYNRLPEVGSSEFETNSGGGGTKLLEILLAMEGEGSSAQNIRSVIFLQTKEAKGNKGGLQYAGGGDSIQGMFDPFGNPYTVILNTEYDDALTFSFDGQQVKLRGAQVAVYSPGGDKKQGTPDDIKSWK